MGAGACVADDPTSARVTTDGVIGPMNVIDELEIPGAAPENIDPRVVVVTGIDWPGRASTQPNIDVRNAEELSLDPDARMMCALVDQLPSSDVCSSLCDPDAFIARVLTGGDNGCTTQSCALPGGTTVNVDVCN